MVTGYEVEMYHHIKQIAQSLDRIANCMEAEEKRKRREESGGFAPYKNEDDYLKGECSSSLCTSPVVTIIDGKGWCKDHIEIGFTQIGAAIRAAKAGFQYLEDAIREEAQRGGDQPA
jgi:hypothetical protein